MSGAIKINKVGYLWLSIYMIPLEHKHKLSTLMLNSVLFKHVPAYLYMMNWTHLLMKISVPKQWSWSFNFVLWEIKMHHFFWVLLFWWLLPGIFSHWNSKSFMNNNVMNLSNNYENLITSTMSYNWLKDRLHFLLYNPRFANRRRNCLSLTE